RRHANRAAALPQQKNAVVAYRTLPRPPCPAGRRGCRSLGRESLVAVRPWLQQERHEPGAVLSRQAEDRPGESGHTVGPLGWARPGASVGASGRLRRGRYLMYYRVMLRFFLNEVQARSASVCELPCMSSPPARGQSFNPPPAATSPESNSREAVNQARVPAR